MSERQQVAAYRRRLAGGLLVAPLAGTSDPAWYCLLADAEPAAFYGEMITADGLFRGSRKTRAMICGLDGGRRLPGCEHPRAYPELGVPVACQLFGHLPEAFAQTAAFVEACGYEAIDLNYGCPAKKVVRSGNGVALMREPGLAVEIARATVESVALPVSAKLRLGFADDPEAYLRLGEALAGAGVACLILHARTREQVFGGRADWGAVERLVESVEIPVIGNGDIEGPEDARRMLEQTGCHGVMVGRRLIRAPWEAGRISAALRGEEPPPEPDWSERLEWTRRHGRRLAAYYGEKTGMMRIRRFALYYLREVRGARELRRRIVRVASLAELDAVLDEARELGGEE